MNASMRTASWDGVDRRSPNSCRRKNPDRRSTRERRRDPRDGEQAERSLFAWFRSMTKSRLGVDRRKGVEQRVYDRRCNTPCSLLTQEELEALLK